MIQALGKNIKLEQNNNVFTIYTWERLLIRPLERKIITLPYRLLLTDKFINFELDKELSLKGLQVVWHNLNQKNNKILEFLLLNNNFDSSIFNGTQSVLNQITGSKYLSDIIPNTVFGRIYI